MATIANFYDPNNPNANANTGGGGTVMPSSSGGSSSVASGDGSGGTSTPSPASTPYQPPNVSQYLAANQGAGQQLTQGITNNVQNQANKLNTDASAAQNNLNKQYDTLNSNLNTNTANQVAQTAFQNPQQLLDAYNAAKTNSSSQPLSSDQQSQANTYNQFQQLNNGAYNQGIQNYGNQGQQANAQLQGQLGSLTQQTGSAANEMGRNQLLQNVAGRAGDYNQGEQTLDSLFLQGAPGQRNAGGLSNLQQLQQNLGGIGNQAKQSVQGLNLDSQNKLRALQGLSAADQANIKNLFLNGGQGGTGLNQINQNVQSEAAALQQNAPRQQAEIQQAFEKNQFTPEQLQALGLEEGTHTWGLTGQDLMNAGNYQNTALANTPEGLAAQAATPEEFARYNALNQLAGGPNGLQNNIFGSATQAGGYNPYTFDPQATKAAIDQRKQDISKNGIASSLQSAITSPGINSLFWGLDTRSFLNDVMGKFNNGEMTPEQVKNAVDTFSKRDLDMGSGSSGMQARRPELSEQRQYYQNIFSPFNNYYNSKYAPAAASVLGGNSPDASPLPTNADTGQIDWSKINAPKGK